VDPRKLRGKVDLNINTAIPLGLIVNELVTNIWKYAFPHGKKGEIDINLSGAAEDKYVLLVKDNGGGFPKGLVFRKTESLGMQIVIVLVEQLDGTIELERTERTRYKDRLQRA
jgi:two-component sensor histidine kinase